ncbi:response regulator [Bacillus subtilis subsp. subtilis]|nr:response regulator [Bacillus subtilis subsp. subtilis]
MQNERTARAAGQPVGASLQSALIDLLYRQSFAVLLANLAIPLPVASVLWGTVPARLLVGWCAAIVLLTAVRLVLWRRYFARADRHRVERRWIWGFCLLSWTSALLWGALGGFAFLPDHPHLLAFTCIVLTGMSCGAVPSLSPFPPAYAGTLVALLAPFAVSALLQDGAIYRTYLVFVLCLFAANLYYSRITYRSMLETVRLRFENLALIEDLQAQRDKAQAADQAKSRFLAAASHDLRQPIHALSLFVAALSTLAQRGQLSAVEACTLAARLRAVIANVSGLLNGLLDVSRLEAGVVAVARAPMPLQPLLDQLQHQYAPQAVQRGLRWRVVGTRAWVDTDPVLLTRMLDNLLVNALRYTRHGGVLLGVRRQAGQIRIQVLDSGPGIAVDQQSRVFDEFVQLHNPQRDREQGLGLGLAIVRRTATLLGHGLQLHSTPGRGTCVTVSMPRVAPVPVVPATRAAADAPVGLGIVVVDDDAVVLEAVAGLLRLWGHRVHAACSVSAVLAVHLQAERQAPALVDVLLVDHRLGDGMDGPRAIALLQDYLGSAVPAIILSGDTSAQGLREATASGHRLLHKPIDSDLLADALQAAVRRGGWQPDC